MPKKVYLVDGTYELFRNYYGAPSRRCPQGHEVGAVFGIVLSLASFIKSHQVTHIACGFDTVIESFRNTMFAGYKTGEGMDEEILHQFPLVEAAVRALGITCWSLMAFEADDGLASGAQIFSQNPEVGQVILCSPDKDLSQCVTPDGKIIVWDRRQDIYSDWQGVIAKFGVKPTSIPDYLALVGDSADGIPGIPRWGAKSTAQVLAVYEHLEDIPENAADWSIKVRGAATLAENFAIHKQDALLYRQLATLRRDVTLDQRLSSIARRPPDPAAWQRLGLGDDAFFINVTANL